MLEEPNESAWWEFRGNKDPAKSGKAFIAGADFAHALDAEPSSRYLKRYAVDRLARNGMERAAVAGLARITARLIKKHPLVAAELFLSGAGRAGEVGWQELVKQFKGRSRRRKKVSHPIPLTP